MGDLLTEGKPTPTKGDPAVDALYSIITRQSKPENIVQQARMAMGPILDVICGGLAQSTEQRIAYLFRYELDKLEMRQAYESDRLDAPPARDRKSTRLNSSHQIISYAVFCLKKKQPR